MCPRPAGTRSSGKSPSRSKSLSPQPPGLPAPQTASDLSPGQSEEARRLDRGLGHPNKDPAPHQLWGPKGIPAPTPDTGSPADTQASVPAGRGGSSRYR